MVTTDAIGLGNAIPPEWVVCQTSARAVVDGVVVCPRGLLSHWASCLECRFLEGTEGDRDRGWSCSVEPVAADDETHPEPPTAAWTELLIEML